MIRNLVRKLSAWAWSDEVRASDGLAVLERLHAEPGAMEIHVRNHPALQECIAQCFAAIVTKSPNYAEMSFETRAGGQFITVTVQKSGRPTPHQLRMAAEAERDKLAEQVQSLLTQSHGNITLAK